MERKGESRDRDTSFTYLGSEGRRDMTVGKRK